MVSDLQLGSLSGWPREGEVPYDFEYNQTPPSESEHSLLNSIYSDFRFWSSYPIQMRQTTWRQSPPGYPTFAQYREESPAEEGIDDTGVLLRAFVPFLETSSRESLRSYSGKAVVLGSRVSCQAPILEDLHYDRGTSVPCAHRELQIGSGHHRTGSLSRVISP